MNKLWIGQLLENMRDYLQTPLSTDGLCKYHLAFKRCYYSFNLQLIFLFLSFSPLLSWIFMSYSYHFYFRNKCVFLDFFYLNLATQEQQNMIDNAFVSNNSSSYETVVISEKMRKQQSEVRFFLNKKTCLIYHISFNLFLIINFRWKFCTKNKKCAVESSIWTSRRK